MNAAKIKKKTTGKATNKPSISSTDGEQLLNDLSTIGKNGKTIVKIEVDSRRR